MLSKTQKEDINLIYKNFNWTPVMKQWKEIKENSVKKYGENTIVLFQLGTFFETYFEDAYITSMLIGQTLTSKNKNNPYAAPMSGSPLVSSLKKAKTLVKKGYNVIIVEEQGISGTKGFKREITQILTPGTINEIEGKENNYVYSILKKVNGYSISLLDSNSNYFYGLELEENNISFLFDLFESYKPREILLDSNIKKEIFNNLNINIIVINDRMYRKEKINSKILGKIGELPSLKESISFLLGYVEEIYKIELTYIEDIDIINPKNYFFLDVTTIKNLEILRNSKGYVENSLLEIIRNTLTAMGSRTIKNVLIKPLKNKEIIEERLKVVELFLNPKNKEAVKNIINTLLKINDIERLSSKLITNNITPQEILNLRNSLSQIKELKETLSSIKGIKESEMLKYIYSKLLLFKEFIEEVDFHLKEKGSNNIKEGNIIKRGVDKELDKLIDKTSDKQKWYESYEKELKEKYKINLKVNENNLGAFIEIKKDIVLPLELENKLKRIKMLKDCDRYETKELISFYRESLEAYTKRKELEYIIFNKLRIILSKDIYKIQKVSKRIGMIDVFISFYIQALNENYTKPIISLENIFDIKEGRHPVIEKLTFFSKNNTFQKEKNFHIITGPNMGGKSTYIRQVAIITLLAQIGSYIPANKNSVIGIVDGIFTRIGSGDNLSEGESTFFVEAKETSKILSRSTNKSLIILDELGRGTSFEDGESLSKAIIAFLTKKKIRTFFSTHYHSLNDLENNNENIKNYSFGAYFEKEKIKFNHKIEEKGTKESYGLEIAKLAGIPEDVISLARNYKKTFNN